MRSADQSFDHKNNIGLSRLIFATLVIVSHSAEMIDGNRSREALTSIIGIMTFGEIAVDGFFIISGYLIVQSFDRSTSSASFFLKRIKRIFPGFLVAYFVCVYLVAPFAGIDMSMLTWRDHIRIVFDGLQLKPPSGFLLPAFHGLPYPVLNGAMWSIAYEFRCYLLVPVFGYLGLFHRKHFFLFFTVVLLLISALRIPVWLPNATTAFHGDATLLIRMLGLFCTGSCFYLFRDFIKYKTSVAVVSALILTLALWLVFVSEMAFAILGGYLIFWFSFAVKSEVLASINSRNDISYGVYLYGWPIQGLIIYHFGLRSPELLTLLTVPIVFIIGYVSWKNIEERFVRPQHRTSLPHS